MFNPRSFATVFAATLGLTAVHDATFQPYCQDFASAADRASCQALLDCVRQTNCIQFGNVACLCDPSVDAVTCKSGFGATGAHGACLSEFQAAFPQGSTAADIFNNIGDVTIPGGAAMNLAQCDHDFCGVPAVGGNNECLPYCK